MNQIEKGTIVSFASIKTALYLSIKKNNNKLTSYVTTPYSYYNIFHLNSFKKPTALGNPGKNTQGSNETKKNI